MKIRTLAAWLGKEKKKGCVKLKRWWVALIVNRVRSSWYFQDTQIMRITSLLGGNCVREEVRCDGELSVCSSAGVRLSINLRRNFYFSLSLFVCLGRSPRKEGLHAVRWLSKASRNPVAPCHYIPHKSSSRRPPAWSSTKLQGITLPQAAYTGRNKKVMFMLLFPQAKPMVGGLVCLINLPPSWFRKLSWRVIFSLKMNDVRISVGNQYNAL